MIELAGVSKVFDGKRKVVALENLDLVIGRGEMVAIVGPSGSGKSTLLNLIGGLDRPSQGEIRIDGSALGGLSDDELTRLRERIAQLTRTATPDQRAMVSSQLEIIDLERDRRLSTPSPQNGSPPTIQ